jgi:glycosyltransferase involved in cell wall biosynthesis
LDKNSAVPGEVMKVSVIIPAYNEEQAIRQVVIQVKQVLETCHYEHEILVVDDGSVDKTAEEAAQGGAVVLQRPYNIGNGAAVKHGIRHATGDVVLLMDGDGQHDPADIPRLLSDIDRYEMVVGARQAESETELHRDMANGLYNRLASYVVGYKVKDLTSGFRAIKAKVAKNIVYLLPNGFSYPSTSTVVLFRSGYSVKYVPIKTAARIGQSKIRLLRDGLGFLFILLRIAVMFVPMRIFLPLSAVIFLPGFSYAIYRLILGRSWTLPIVISITAGLLIFALGLISQQISLLRMDRSED